MKKSCVSTTIIKLLVIRYFVLLNGMVNKICIDEKTYTFDDILKNPELFCSLVEHENDLLALDTLS